MVLAQGLYWTLHPREQQCCLHILQFQLNSYFTEYLVSYFLIMIFIFDAFNIWTFLVSPWQLSPIFVILIPKNFSRLLLKNVLVFLASSEKVKLYVQLDYEHTSWHWTVLLLFCLKCSFTCKKYEHHYFVKPII